LRLACIDVGSNTTRLLVAEPIPTGMRQIQNERDFTLIGKSIGADGCIPPEKVAETARVVAGQVDLAHKLGADRVRAVATAAIREAVNSQELVSAIEKDAGITLEVLAGEKGAELAFRGACCVAGGSGSMAVVDVGGGSTEIAIGEVGGAVHHALSLPIGSSVLAARHFASDPPTLDEVIAARADAATALERLGPHPVSRVVAVGGSASSLQRFAGSELDVSGLGAAISVLLSEHSSEIAKRYELDPERVRLLPAGLAILAEAARLFDKPLRICKGGLREGVILEMMGGPS
jgi:exopolyphosphatase/guanosine-5'-triphosphate,3'-diphosphate pyrophosphatase